MWVLLSVMSPQMKSVLLRKMKQLEERVREKRRSHLWAKEKKMQFNWGSLIKLSQKLHWPNVHGVSEKKMKDNTPHTKLDNDCEESGSGKEQMNGCSLDNLRTLLQYHQFVWVALKMQWRQLKSFGQHKGNKCCNILLVIPPPFQAHL